MQLKMTTRMYGALREIERRGGHGHLQDIRQGGFGTKNGHDASALVRYILLRRYLRRTKRNHYSLTATGKRFARSLLWWGKEDKWKRRKS